MSISYDPPVSPDEVARWQTALDQAVPRVPGGSWLLIHWVPGDEWDVVQRWVIYDMLPAFVLRDAADIKRRNGRSDSDNWELTLLQQLDGPHPRLRGRWDSVLKTYVRDADVLIDRYQWELYRAHDCLAYPFWIVQGSMGGHPKVFTDWEAQAFLASGMDPEAPPAGALPYAPVDQRVIRQMVRRDRLRQMQEALGRLGQAMRAERQQRAQAMDRKWREDYLATLDDYFTDAIRGANYDDTGMARVDHDSTPPLELAEERFLTSNLPRTA